MNITIAIPTNDKINISEKLEDSDFFKIITVECGKVKDEKFLQNKLPKTLKNSRIEYVAGISSMIPDCNYILVKECSEEIRNYFKEKKIEIVPSQEKIITNAVLNLICELAQKESDTCCCP
jgi:predicted Fe-Mo cluster-binding NifX family protein